MEIEDYTNEQLLAECIRRKLISSATASRILKTSKRDLQWDADLWILENPVLFEEMIAKAKSMARKKRKFGAKLIAEEVRWDRKSREKRKRFKLDNRLVPYLAVRMIEQCPELSSFISRKKGCPHGK